MTAEKVLTIIPTAVFGIGCAMLVASHVVRVSSCHVRRQAIIENNEAGAKWADAKVNSGSWSIGAIGIALAIFGLGFIMAVSMTAAMDALKIGGGLTFGIMALLRAFDVLHPTEPRKDHWRAQIAAGLSSRRPSGAPASPES